MKAKDLGIAVVGSGRIGTLRARLAARHPAVRFLAVSDRDPAQAKKLAELAGADFHSADNDAVIALRTSMRCLSRRPKANTPRRCAGRSNSAKPVLVEKPLALSLNDAEAILRTLKTTGGTLRVGYSRRFKECFLRAKEQMIHGRLGKVSGALARVYNSRAQTFAILKRDPHATPVLDVLTYYVDLICWFLEGNKPVEVVARGQSGIFRDAGYSAHDVTWALVTFADGAVVNFGIAYALPARYPTQGQSDRVELLGSDGTMTIDDDHMEHLLFSEKGIPHPYVPATGRDGVPRQQYGGRLGDGRFLGAARQRDARLARFSFYWPAQHPRYGGAGYAQFEDHLRHRTRGLDRAGGAARWRVGGRSWCGAQRSSPASCAEHGAPFLVLRSLPLSTSAQSFAPTGVRLRPKS